MRTLTTLTLIVAAPALASAQGNPDEFSQPPLLPAQPDAAPPQQSPNPATPPPPGATPPPPGTAAPTGYPYSPYGQPLAQPEQPPAEIGLMISEVAFGALTAAGVSVLPYFLLRPTFEMPEMGNLLLILIFSAVPLAVSQTELSLANGSRYYYAESWPPALAGLAAQAAVVGLFFVMDPWPQMQRGNYFPQTFLLVGTIGIVPIAEMVAINVAKAPRNKLPYGGFGALDYRPDRGWSVRAPPGAPFVADTRAGRSLGVHVGLLGGAF